MQKYMAYDRIQKHVHAFHSQGSVGYRYHDLIFITKCIRQGGLGTGKTTFECIFTRISIILTTEKIKRKENRYELFYDRVQKHVSFVRQC